MMVVSEIMTVKPLTVQATTPIAELAALLHERHLPGVPVVRQDNTVLGVVTRQELFSSDGKMYYPSYIHLLGQTDFVMGDNKTLPYEAERVFRITAQEVMDAQSSFLAPDMPLTKAAEKMLSENRSFMPVVDSHNQLQGSLTTDALLKAFSGVEIFPSKIRVKPAYLKDEFDYVEKHFTSRFAFVTKARANIWLTAATVLFIVGFIAGVVYVVNPNIFSLQGSKLEIQAPQP